MTSFMIRPTHLAQKISSIQTVAKFLGSTRYRTFSRKYPSISDNNPFDILGIPKNSSYDDVKKHFLQLALKHHPDLSGDEEGDVEMFIRIRQAFEQIRETDCGGAAVSGEESYMSDQEFEVWFHEETGHQDVLFRMDITTRREVIDIANSQSQGGLDRGGMWEMARSMAEQQKNFHKQKAGVKGTIAIDGESSPAPTSRRRRRSRK
eukprot:Nitzschia sp. Nitz4//scaffold322_size40381//18114//18731//NITZ4_007562-RA/size40381-processed-gene-0.22-mRNA-1//-1//CDS//3329547833//1280//frame0